MRRLPRRRGWPRPARSAASRPGRRAAFLVVSAVLSGLMVFGAVTLQALASQTSFRMQELTRRSASLEASYGQLKLELAELSAPQRIADEARSLGMITPREIHPLTVRGLPPSADQTDRSDDGVAFALKRLIQEDP